MADSNVSEVLSVWRARPGPSGETARREKWMAEVVENCFGADRPARSLSRVEITEFRALLDETYSAATSRILFALLVRSFEFGHRAGLISVNPARGLMRPTPTTMNGGVSR